MVIREMNESADLQGADAPAPSGFSLEGLPALTVFGIADRRCRTAVDPSPRDLLLRSSALRSLGQHDAALNDLRAAFRCDSEDVIVARSVLAWDGDAAQRTVAAKALIGNVRAGEIDLDAALRHLGSIGTEIIVRAQRVDRSVFGWVASPSDTEPSLEVTHEGGTSPVPLSDRPVHPFPSFRGRLSAFLFACDPRLPIELLAQGSHGRTTLARLPAIEPPFPPLLQPASGARPATLNVIVPLYVDHAATKACLEALALQDCAIPLRFFIVDDHSPEPEISALAERFCRLHDATLIVHRVNHGFAGAVNSALARCADGDVLLLNSDVTLPPAALDRLIDAAYGSERIGTVMPLSNDSELTSFPIPFRPNPLPAPDLAIRIDDAARRANGHDVVDLVNTIGFCLFITRGCLRETAPLSHDYARGYYEDVDIALRARQRGFRNVAAVGVYVAHGSGRSFRDEKGGLVSRNLPILCERFPSFRAESEAFVRADPLRAARGAIEAHLPPGQPAHLLVGAEAPPGSPLSFRARRIAEQGGFPLMVSWRERGNATRISIEAPSGFGPRSLEFQLDAAGLESLSGYILALRLVQIELCDLHTIPSPLYRLLLRTSAPILFFVASLEDAMLVGSSVDPSRERLTSRDITVDFLEFDRASDPFAYRIPQFLMRSPAPEKSKFVTADSMAEAVCASLRQGDRSFPDDRTRRPVRLPEPPAARRLVAIPVPRTSTAVERLLLDLARHLRPRLGTRLLVLGRCVDDRALMAVGNVQVTGAVAFEDYASLVAAYGADALFLPYRTSLYGVIEVLSERCRLPRGYFDWSAGLMDCRPDDFVLDCRLGGDVVCSEFARWCAPAGPASEVQL